MLNNKMFNFDKNLIIIVDYGVMALNKNYQMAFKDKRASKLNKRVSACQEINFTITIL